MFACWNTESIENVNGATPTSSTHVDPNALVNPDGGQTQQLQANPNALVNPDGGVPHVSGPTPAGYDSGPTPAGYGSGPTPPGYGYGPMPAGYGSAGQMTFGQFSVPLDPAGHVTPPVVTVVHTTHVVPVAPFAPAMPHVSTAHAERPEKFNGTNFKQWQQKMLFYLTTLNLSRYLSEETPMLTAESDTQTVFAVDAWKHSDYICRNYVLNGLSGPLYDMYSSKITSKDLWESLDRKYKTEDAGAKKWIGGHFLNY